MKCNSLFLVSIASFFGISSCKKEDLKISPLASLTITTAVIGGGNIKLNSVQDSANAYNAKVFGITPGNTSLKVYPTNNPSIAYYNSTQQTENGGLYSLFLSGQGTTFDGVFIKDNIPSNYSDSSVGVRVVNLSPNSTPINITLASATSTNIFSNIAYKQVTNFTKFSLPTVIPAGSVSFQVRDASNNLLATYVLPTSVNSTYPGISVQLSRFRNITLVIKGLQGTTTGTDAFGIFPVANY